MVRFGLGEGKVIRGFPVLAPPIAARPGCRRKIYFGDDDGGHEP